MRPKYPIASMAAAFIDPAAAPNKTMTKNEDLAVSVTRSPGPGDDDVTTTHITISMPPASRAQPEKRFASQITLDSDGTVVVQVNGLTKHVSSPILQRGKRMFVESPRPNGTKALKVEQPEPESPQPQGTDTQTTVVGDVERLSQDGILPTLSEHADSMQCEGQAPVQLEACWDAMDAAPFP